MEEICDVCGLPLDEKNISRCRLCGRKFHMKWSVDAQIQNCGQVWFDKASGGMAFACNICVGENPELSELIVGTE